MRFPADAKAETKQQSLQDLGNMKGDLAPFEIVRLFICKSHLSIILKIFDFFHALTLILQRDMVCSRQGS